MKKSPLRGEYFIEDQLPGSPDWGFDFFVGAGFSAGIKDVIYDRRESLLHSRDFVRGIPVYENGLSYLYIH